MIIMFLILAILAFLMGFFLGALPKQRSSAIKKAHSQVDYETLEKEYENFLNYDGTEQL